MHRVTKSVLVPHAAAEMFALVDDVETYPQFLPWCGGATVLERHENGKTARIDIDYHGVKAHFTTANENQPPDRIVHTERFDEAWYPGESIITTELTDQGGKTLLTVTLLYVSKEARDGVLKSPMESGVAASYARLDDWKRGRR